MTKALFTARDGALWPADEEASKIVANAARRNKAVLVDAHIPRNPRHHSLYWALMTEIAESGAWEGDAESLSQWIKIATGLVDTIVGPDGKPYYVPRSISWASMDQASFARHFDRACFVISTRLLANDRWEELRDKFVSAVEGGLPERRAA